MYLYDVKKLQKFKTSGFGSLLDALFGLGKELLCSESYHVFSYTRRFFAEKIKEDLFPQEVTS